ncbi:SulP family sulfate permease [Rhodococcus sp. SMB37]|uniref:SulP family inorganic anion transporter n=1 Tax=Rhodococcus sp. SMB37 TaxID=2512213 RepID=UPI001050A676|nr:SulP family inorganic anion transporter [Rhodococcus sp. SMB37]TCN52702.1 SulP family sulfate permease [Rhodococcus sp. SMB37]
MNVRIRVPQVLRARSLAGKGSGSFRLQGRPTLDALRNPQKFRVEVLAGLVTALALIPETISFSIIAGVDPAVGLFTSCIFAMTIAIVGGRPAMISAAAGSVALVTAPLVRDHGVNYLVGAVILAGFLQILLSRCGVTRLMRFIPNSVVTGFVNALAILIFSAQLPHLIDVPWLVYPLTGAGVIVMFVMPKLTRSIPAPLVATAVLTVITVVFAFGVPRVGDEGELSAAFPVPGIPGLPVTFETLRILAPYAIAVALVGLLESLITARMVDELTDTHSDHRHEARGQGVSNVVTGLFGGMGGCAMIGQTMMNVKSCGATTRISTFVAGASLLVLVTLFGPALAAIPMAALVAVMIMVSMATMDWGSVKPSTLRRMPRSETTTMLLTVAVTVATHNLAYGVIAGVLCAMVLFVAELANGTAVEPTSVVAGEASNEGRTYRVTGQLFFASSNTLVQHFDFSGDPSPITIDLSGTRVWDGTAVSTLNAVEARYTKLGKTVRLTGWNGPSAALRTRVSGSPVP